MASFFSLRRVFGLDQAVEQNFNDIENAISLLKSQIRFGSGTPEAAVTAPVGTLYLRTNGGAVTTLYVKESGTGNTGWAAK